MSATDTLDGNDVITSTDIVINWNKMVPSDVDFCCICGDACFSGHHLAAHLIKHTKDPKFNIEFNHHGVSENVTTGITVTKPSSPSYVKPPLLKDIFNEYPVAYHNSVSAPSLNMLKIKGVRSLKRGRGRTATGINATKPSSPSYIKPSLFKDIFNEYPVTDHNSVSALPLNMLKINGISSLKRGRGRVTTGINVTKPSSPSYVKPPLLKDIFNEYPVVDHNSVSVSSLNMLKIKGIRSLKKGRGRVRNKLPKMKSSENTPVVMKINSNLENRADGNSNIIYLSD